MKILIWDLQLQALVCHLKTYEINQKNISKCIYVYTFSNGKIKRVMAFKLKKRIQQDAKMESFKKNFFHGNSIVQQ